MVSITLNHVSVHMPVFDGLQRSLKRQLLGIGTGGTIKRDAKNRIHIHALDDVSLRVEEGDRVGLIGHNGAGKSTMLRVMAGIYEPTSGQVATIGRVSALFDLSSGMDAELSGYENIDFIGSFYGFSRDRIRELYADIEAFTELGDYLHMPVRTYSAGMQLRLSFSLATSINPEILLLDEAISAGDAAFLEKATKRADALYSRAKILVVASHDNNLLRQMCNKVAWLKRGQLVQFGPAAEVIAAYEASFSPPTVAGAA